MGVITSSSRVWHTHRPAVVACFIVLVLVLLWRARSLLYETWTLAALPFLWSRHASHFYLSPDADGFDISFANYSVDQTDAAPFPDRVPPILHHISLGSGATENAKWAQGRQSCLDLHPDWEAFLWTDDVVETFVASHFPEIYGTWKSYRYLVQRVDALRYMVLYHYGGVILDMDLECKRALGPLRRFEFVAPAAHPTGFSIGFMMASKRNEYVGSLVANLPRYNRHWLGLPYPAVMFSTGCHYASTIHALQPNRSELKILAGLPGVPALHSLNGRVSTPLFNHLGSSSWHSYDAAMLKSLGRSRHCTLPLLFAASVGLALIIVRRTRRRGMLKL